MIHRLTGCRWEADVQLLRDKGKGQNQRIERPVPATVCAQPSGAIARSNGFALPGKASPQARRPPKAATTPSQVLTDTPRLRPWRSSTMGAGILIPLLRWHHPSPSTTNRPQPAMIFVDTMWALVVGLLYTASDMQMLTLRITT